jgi:hypothetical protein
MLSHPCEVIRAALSSGAIVPLLPVTLVTPVTLVIW